MSDFKFNCPHCQQPLEAPQERLGIVTDCPSCHGRIQLSQAQSPEPIQSASPILWLQGVLPWGKGASCLAGWILAPDALYVVNGPTTFREFPLIVKIMAPVGLIGCLPMLLLAIVVMPLALLVDEPRRRQAWANFLKRDLAALAQSKCCKRIQLSRIRRRPDFDPSTRVLQITVVDMTRPFLIRGLNAQECVAFQSEAAQRCTGGAARQ